MYKEREYDWQGCLQSASEQSKEALAQYDEDKPALSKVTFLFNRARSLEESRLFTQAVSIYRVSLFWTLSLSEGNV